MKKPLVSVVVNNRDYARFLPHAIDSALAQSYGRIEVVVVDDGSTDSSRDVIAAYGNRIVPVLKDGGGQASSFDAGLVASHGDVVIHLDADDCLLPTAAEHAVPCFMDAKVAKVHWPLRIIDDNGRETGAIHPPYPLPEGNLQAVAASGGPMSHISPPTSGNAWARWYLERVHPVHDYGDGHGADAYLIALAPVYGTIRALASPEGLYRVHDGNFSGRSRHVRNQRYLRRYPEECRVLSEHLRRVGIDVEPTAWMGPDTPYQWMQALDEATRCLEAIIPPGSSFILVDGDEWGEPWGADKVLADRVAWPFVEHDGAYWGPPENDAAAIAEVERQRSRGARFIVFAWPAFWWLDHYAAFRDHLFERHRPRCENDRVIVFELV